MFMQRINMTWLHVSELHTLRLGSMQAVCYILKGLFINVNTPNCIASQYLHYAPTFNDIEISCLLMHFKYFGLIMIFGVRLLHQLAKWRVFARLHQSQD